MPRSAGGILAQPSSRSRPSSAQFGLSVLIEGPHITQQAAGARFPTSGHRNLYTLENSAPIRIDKRRFFSEFASFRKTTSLKHVGDPVFLQVYTRPFAAGPICTNWAVDELKREGQEGDQGPCCRSPQSQSGHWSTSALRRKRPLQSVRNDPYPANAQTSANGRFGFRGATCASMARSFSTTEGASPQWNIFRNLSQY